MEIYGLVGEVVTTQARTAWTEDDWDGPETKSHHESTHGGSYLGYELIQLY